MSGNKTLVGVMVAIAALIISGIFCVFMFISVGNTQSKARHLDLATITAQSAIEEFKSGLEVERVTYLDKDFNTVSERLPDGFMLVVEITMENTVDSNSDESGLYEVNATITKNSPYLLEGQDSVFIFSLSTMVYRGPGN